MEDPSWPWPDSPGVFSLNESFELDRQLKAAADRPSSLLRRVDSRPDNAEDVVRISENRESRRFSPYRRANSNSSKDSLKDLDDGSSGSARIGSPLRALMIGSPVQHIQGFSFGDEGLVKARLPIPVVGSMPQGRSWSGLELGLPTPGAAERRSSSRRSSAPMAVPGSSDHDVEAIIDAAEAAGKFIPPHELARLTGHAHNVSGDTSPFTGSLSESMPYQNGMGLKGRDAFRVRNAVFRQTGFLEERSNSSVEDSSDTLFIGGGIAD